jgi:hypothetical protein
MTHLVVVLQTNLLIKDILEEDPQGHLGHLEMGHLMDLQEEDHLRDHLEVDHLMEHQEEDLQIEDSQLDLQDLLVVNHLTLRLGELLFLQEEILLTIQPS